MKYIIKNCPAVYIFKSGYSCNNLDYDEHKFCKDIPNCLLKRIVEIFKDFRKDNIVINGNQILVEEILNLLEIEEVE